MRHTTAWGITSGLLLLPYTIRSTRKHAVADWEQRTMTPWKNRGKGWTNVVKLDIAWERPDAK